MTRSLKDHAPDQVFTRHSRIVAKLEGTDLVNHVLRVAEDGTMTIEQVPGA